MSLSDVAPAGSRQDRVNNSAPVASNQRHRQERHQAPEVPRAGQRKLSIVVDHKASHDQPTDEPNRHRDDCSLSRRAGRRNKRHHDNRDHRGRVRGHAGIDSQQRAPEREKQPALGESPQPATLDNSVCHTSSLHRESPVAGRLTRPSRAPNAILTPGRVLAVLGPGCPSPGSRLRASSVVRWNRPSTTACNRASTTMSDPDELCPRPGRREIKLHDRAHAGRVELVLQDVGLQGCGVRGVQHVLVVPGRRGDRL